MGRKRKAADVPGDHGADGDKKGKRGRKAAVVPEDHGAAGDNKGQQRNRASPSGLCKLYDDLTPGQIADVVKMEFDSMLDIKCPILHNGLVKWFAGTYDEQS